MPSTEFIRAFRFATVSLIAAPALSAAPAHAAPPDAVVHSLTDGGKTVIKDLAAARAGKVVAIHLLPKTRTPECDAFVRDVLAKRDTLAGVSHLFVKPDAPDELRSWADELGITDVYRDDGSLARELGLTDSVDLSGVKTTPPATIVLAADGSTIFTHTGTHAHDHVAFTTLSQRVEAARRAPLEQYNLPKKSGKIDPLAVEGYDVVAYQTLGKPTRGDARFTSHYRGVRYQFSSADHRARFAQDPEAYVPTCGGWCASAIAAKSEKVEINPKSFKVKDGRLHLFYTDFFSDALKDWNRNEKAWEPLLDPNWKKVSGEDNPKPRPAASTPSPANSPATDR